MTDNELGNRYALHALRDKRATLAGEIADLKKQLAWRVSQLDHVDACLNIFEPGFDPQTNRAQASPQTGQAIPAR